MFKLEEENANASNQSISRKEDQFLNKEVLNFLNASLDMKKKHTLIKNNENSFNEMSTIVQENNKDYFEFSQSDFSIALENKEKETKDVLKNVKFSNIIENKNLKNFIPKDQIYKKLEEHKNHKNSKNLNTNNSNNNQNNMHSVNHMIEESKVDTKIQGGKGKSNTEFNKEK